MCGPGPAQSRAKATSAFAGNAGDPSMCGSREGCEVRARLGANSLLTPETEPPGAAVQLCVPLDVAGGQQPSGLRMDAGPAGVRGGGAGYASQKCVTHSAAPTKNEIKASWGLSGVSVMLECPRREGHRKPGCDGPVPMTLSGLSLVTLFRWPVFCHAPSPGSSHPTSTCLVRTVTCPLCHVTTRGRTPLSAVRVLGQVLFLPRPHVTTTPWAQPQQR